MLEIINKKNKEIINKKIHDDIVINSESLKYTIGQKIDIYFYKHNLTSDKNELKKKLKKLLQSRENLLIKKINIDIKTHIFDDISINFKNDIVTLSIEEEQKKLMDSIIEEEQIRTRMLKNSFKTSKKRLTIIQKCAYKIKKRGKNE